MWCTKFFVEEIFFFLFLDLVIGVLLACKLANVNKGMNYTYFATFIFKFLLLWIKMYNFIRVSSFPILFRCKETLKGLVCCSDNRNVSKPV